ncbi:hypothetical protein LTR93_011785 [Exophiala xenobiotica]|nr:hypothetical protein LTR93_011785 [Exophiala xenobiotica]
MREEVTSYGKHWIIFRQADRSTTTNLVSNVADDTDQDFQLTYIFEWNFPEVKEGTSEHDEAIEMTSALSHYASFLVGYQTR